MVDADVNQMRQRLQQPKLACWSFACHAHVMHRCEDACDEAMTPHLHLHLAGHLNTLRRQGLEVALAIR